LLVSKPREEVRAFNNLSQQGYHTYLPLVMRECRYRGKKQLKSEALFSRYLFVNLSQSENWAPMRSTPGVSGLVGFGVGRNQYRSIPDRVVELLKKHEDETGYHQLEQEAWFSRGDPRRIHAAL